jgi:hypothetical protein
VAVSRLNGRSPRLQPAVDARRLVAGDRSLAVYERARHWEILHRERWHDLLVALAWLDLRARRSVARRELEQRCTDRADAYGASTLDEDGVIVATSDRIPR